jgi:deoxycytidylate deaminase
MLDGDLSLSNLEELRQVKAAVDSIVQCLRVEMETTVVTTHAADEIAVSAYFDFAHGFTVSHRIGEMAAEMEALIELVTGGEATTETARTFHFPD